VHCLKGMKSDKTMTKTVILHQKLFLISEELTRAALLPTGIKFRERTMPSQELQNSYEIPVRIFAVLHDLENRS